MDLFILQAMINGIHTLNIVIDFVQTMQKIPDRCVLFIFLAQAPVVLQEVDLIQNFHQGLPHFFMMNHVLENITAVLRHKRICAQLRHRIHNQILLRFLWCQLLTDLIQPQIMQSRRTKLLIFRKFKWI